MNESQENTFLGESYVNKTTTFNGAEIYWLFKPSNELEVEWTRRIVCSTCFTQNFFLMKGIKIETPYRVLLCSSPTETKSLLYEKSNGKFILQPNAASAVIQEALIASQKATPLMDVHEYVHIIMNDLQFKRSENEVGIGKNIPVWYKEGFAQYIQGKKDKTNYFDLARSLEYLPPVTLEAMNHPTEKSWLEFGIMDQLMVNGNHPGLTSCASFVQFLIDKEKVDFQNFWDLIFFNGETVEFYKKIEEIVGNNLHNIINNYLYYVDKSFIPKDAVLCEMPVAVARDFRGEFLFEIKKYDFLKGLW